MTLPTGESAFQREWPVYEVWFHLWDGLSLDCAADSWSELVPHPTWVESLRSIARELLAHWTAPSVTGVTSGAALVAEGLDTVDTRLGPRARQWLERFTEFDFAFVPSLRPGELNIAWGLYDIAFRDRSVPGLPAVDLERLREVLRMHLRPSVFAPSAPGTETAGPSDWDRSRAAYWASYYQDSGAYDPLQPVHASIVAREARRALTAVSANLGPSLASDLGALLSFWS